MLVKNHERDQTVVIAAHKQLHIHTKNTTNTGVERHCAHDANQLTERKKSFHEPSLDIFREKEI